MYPPPNELYTVFSFIGFVLCVIPLYWHLHAWNTGTCLFLITVLDACCNVLTRLYGTRIPSTGLWSTVISVNPLIPCFERSLTLRHLPATGIQVALNAAIPVCALCITRRLYKVVTLKVVVITNAEKRRAIMGDLLISVGIPILQIISHYIVSTNRYDIYEDFGPYNATAPMLPTFILFTGWPVAIGNVAAFYSVMAIYTLYKRERDFRRMVMTARGLCGGRYIRLMLLSSMNIVATIPLGTYIIVGEAGKGVRDWKSWADTHRYYSTVHQYPAFIWKNISKAVITIEVFRWLIVACAFEIFAFIGFAKEAREHYSLVYAWLTGRIMRKVPPASVPPPHPGTADSTMRAAPKVDEV